MGRKKFKPLLISDVDGVLSAKQFLCDENGKTHKIFGCGDKEGINQLKESGWEIIFISSDLDGYPIVENRVDHLNCRCSYQPSAGRDEYIQSFNNWPIVYVGDSVSDIKAIKQADLSFVPNDGRIEAKRCASFTVKSNSASGVFGDIAMIVDNYDFYKKQLIEPYNGFAEDYISYTASVEKGDKK